jgi:hypothetical protein
VSHFIVIFDRSRRVDAEILRIDDSAEAVSRLFEVESSLRDDETRGVVMLVADDEDTIRATHSHYFKSFDELVELAEA